MNFDLDSRKSIWARNIDESERFYADHGNLVGLNVRLKQFVDRMRLLNRDHQLPPDEKARLEGAGVTWPIFPRSSLRAPFTSIWEMRYAEAASYIKENPTLPPVYKWPDQTLAKWVKIQWNRWDSLSPDKQSRLSFLHLEPGQARRNDWEKRYAKALALFKRIGKYRAATYEKVDKTSDRWIRRQLENWKSLDSQRKEKIFALGISLEPGLAKPLKWENGFQRALRYVEQGEAFGAAGVRSLVRVWIGRQVKRKHRLTADQQQKLVQITSHLTTDYFPLGKE